jgi:hypothetical protein
MIRFAYKEMTRGKQMAKYEVRVVSNISTVWEADSKDEATKMAEAWVGEEYGNLRDKTSYVVKELN